MQLYNISFVIRVVDVLKLLDWSRNDTYSTVRGASDAGSIPSFGRRRLYEHTYFLKYSFSDNKRRIYEE